MDDLLASIRARLKALRSDLERARENERLAISNREALERIVLELEVLAGDPLSVARHLPPSIALRARGMRILTILGCLADVPSGLTVREVVERARGRNVELNMDSTRAQLARALKQGWVQRSGQKFLLKDALASSVPEGSGSGKGGRFASRSRRAG